MTLCPCLSERYSMFYILSRQPIVSRASLLLMRFAREFLPDEFGLSGIDLKIFSHSSVVSDRTALYAFFCSIYTATSDSPRRQDCVVLVGR